MSKFNLYRTPAPSPLKIDGTQLVLTATIYPDERSVSAGGYRAMMTLERLEGLELVVEPFAVETYPTAELAKARVMRFAEERQATDVYLQKS